MLHLYAALALGYYPTHTQGVKQLVCLLICFFCLSVQELPALEIYAMRYKHRSSVKNLPPYSSRRLTVAMSTTYRPRLLPHLCAAATVHA